MACTVSLFVLTKMTLHHTAHGGATHGCTPPPHLQRARREALPRDHHLLNSIHQPRRRERVELGLPRVAELAQPRQQVCHNVGVRGVAGFSEAVVLHQAVVGLRAVRHKHLGVVIGVGVHN